MTRQTGRVEPRRITILGSTGSVGQSTIDLIQRRPDAYEVLALTANGNWEKLASQANILQPKLVALGDTARYKDLREALTGTDIRIVVGAEGLCEAASLPSDWVMAAIVGAAGLRPTLEAVKRGVVVALANKGMSGQRGDFVHGCGSDPRRDVASG